mgnify:CR=1 FL=1
MAPADPRVAIGSGHLWSTAEDLWRFWRALGDGRLLRPGGRVYLDASAARRKHAVTDFFERHIYRGNGSQMVLHEYLAAVARSPFEVEVVHNDRHSYMLTTLAWAQNLERNRETIEARWGTAQFRRFQLYLWGCVDGFRRDIIQAYRVVLRKPA